MTHKVILSLAMAFATAAPLHAQQGDKLLETLKRELAYNFAALQKQDIKPYFMSYRVEDAYEDKIMSSFGVLQSDHEDRTRSVTPQIRVGDMRLDNFKYTTQGMPTQGGRPQSVTTIPFDDNSPAIAANLWTATCLRYQMAQRVYGETRGRSATTTADEDKAACFSQAPAETYYEAPLPEAMTRIDRKAWERRLNAVSAVFKAEPSLIEGSATLNFDVTRTWLVNTEGTSVVQNRVTARVMLQVQAQANDGMMLPLMQDFFAFSPDSLPSQDSMIVVAKDLLKRVVALKNAPVANPYTGPAILSGPASGVFFHEIFGHRLEGHRLKQGGETFRNMVGKAVLPKAFQVYCDPTMRNYHGQDMNGYYLYDSEGVKARRVDNVVDGVLKEFLMSRVPLDSFPQSNGHGRASAGYDAVSRQSNLTVETNTPMTDAQLRYELKKECKKQGKDYGYYFRTVTSGYTMTGEHGSINSFNVTPVEVYRIYVDGRPDELVRGVSLIGTPLSMFSHIKYGGDTPATFTGICGAESGWVPVTANSPAIFVTQIETQRANKAQGVPLLLKAPPFDNARGGDEVETIRAAMHDELQRSIDSLQITGAPRPFWGSYTVNRYRGVAITGELGGISECAVQPWSTAITTHLPLGNFRMTSDITARPLIFTAPSTERVDYGALRRAFWQVSDLAYKNGISFMAEKENYLRQHPLPTSLANIPDMQRSAPLTYAEAATVTEADVDTARLNSIARRLSAIFTGYPHLINTTVKIQTKEILTQRLTSERVDLTLPHNNVTIDVSAQFMDEAQTMLTSGISLGYLSADDLPVTDTLEAQVRSFADDCEALRTAANTDEDYKGPVMFTNKAAMMAFTARYLRDDNFFAHPAITLPKNSLGEKLGKKIMDERITIRNLTAQTSYDGKPLFGHYAVDADGFKPAPEITLVDKGTFKMMLNRATPALYAEKSTGSARLYNSTDATPHVGVGTLCITAEGTTAEDKMLKELIKAAKKKKLDHAYIVDAPDGYSQIRLYRVDVKTGEKKMMKTSNIDMPTEEQLKDLTAISAESAVANFVTPYTYSVVYPKSLIADGVEVKKATFTMSPPLPITYPLQRDK